MLAPLVYIIFFMLREFSFAIFRRKKKEMKGVNVSIFCTVFKDLQNFMKDGTIPQQQKRHQNERNRRRLIVI